MKKHSFQLIALILCVTLIAGIAGVTAYALNGRETEAATATVTAAATTAATAETAPTAVGTDETVYVIADADGAARQLIVADGALGTLDYLDSVRALPVELAVTYTLDGKTLSAAEAAGKSGHLTIRFDYENLQKERVELAGAQEELYVPFAVLTGLLLDPATCTNVEVTNGKLIDDGSHLAVVGLAFPGLQENLAVEKETLEIPDYVEISADVENFALSTVYTVVTNSVFNQLDAEQLTSLDDLSASLDELTEAMAQLTDGSAQLCDGLTTLLASTEQLSDGVGQLSAGLDQLTGNSAALNSGAKQVFETLLATADEQLAEAGLSLPQLTIDNYGTVLNGVLDSLGEESITATARAQVEQAVRAQSDAVRTAVTAAVQPEVRAKVTEAVRGQVRAQVLAAAGLTDESYEAGVAAGLIPAAQQTQLQAALEQQMASDAVQALIAANTEEQMASDEVQSLIAAQTEAQIQTLTDQQMTSAEVRAQIQAGLAQASAGTASLQTLKAQLDSYNSFYRGLAAYTAGVSTAADGAAQLNENMPALVSGVTALRDGAQQLRDGLNEFNEQGVQKLTEALDGDTDNLLARVRATVEASKRYQSFTEENGSGQVKFIYKLDGVRLEEDR